VPGVGIVDAYIPDRKFRNRDPRFATQKRQQARGFTLKDFHYEESWINISVLRERSSNS